MVGSGTSWSFMYKFIEDKDFLKRMRHFCSDIVNKLVVAINNEDFLTVQAHLIGSGAKNLITQNENEDIDLDYNLVIINSSWDINYCKQIKEYVKKKFNDLLKNSGLGACSDSKSCLSTTKLHFIEDYQTKFSIDLAIVFEDKYGNWYRLIHEKTGYSDRDSWIWNISRNSKELTNKVKWLKDNNLWNELRNAYLNKKNMYLNEKEKQHPSFICYIEAVNEIYNKS